MKTVLITGCSSGYGLETARHFHAQGWNVVATMRTPRADLLPKSPRLRVLALDVTRPASIAAAVAAAGPVDVLVNNAGIGLVGAFEATPLATVRELFDTNTFGPIAMMQAVVPQMRERRAGVIVNVTSSATIASFPFAGVYTASKTAITGLTGSVAHELGAFGIRVKLVEPGYGPSTRFAANGGERMQGLLRGLGDERLAAALVRLHAEVHRDWTIHELAAAASLSRSAFFDRFTRTVGVAPMEYLLAWRMALAKELLRRDGMSVSAVAERVGYGSTSTFSTAFSRHVGQSPSRWARHGADGATR